MPLGFLCGGKEKWAVKGCGGIVAAALLQQENIAPEQIKGSAKSNIEEELLCYLKCALISATVAGACKLQTVTMV